MRFNKQWYALYTRNGCERKVANLLSKRGIEYYHPMNQVADKIAYRKKMISQSLFPSFVFVRVAKNDHGHLIHMPGVLGMVYWLKEPAVIRDVEIEMVRQFLHEHASVQLKKRAVNLSEMVRVFNSTPKEQDGETLIMNCMQFQLILPTLGCILLAEVELENVEILRRNLLFKLKILKHWRLLDQFLHKTKNNTKN